MSAIVHEADVVIIGAGVVGLQVARHLTERRPSLKVIVVEAGAMPPPLSERPVLRQRFLDYGENPWRGDLIEDQIPKGTQSFTMVVGGSLTRSTGNTSRMGPDDFKLHSLHGVGVDWPITYDDLEPYYVLAEKAMGVAGEPAPGEKRSAPYPMPALPISYNMKQYKAWGEKSGMRFTLLPQAKNSRPYDGRPACERYDTCNICPTGAKYSPDFTAHQLVDAKRIELHPHRLVRRLVVAQASNRIESALASDQQQPDKQYEYRAKLFVVTTGRVWHAQLLLSSTASRFPDGVANSSGLVGKYIIAMRRALATVELPDIQTFYGVHSETKLYSRDRLTSPKKAPYASFLVALNEAMKDPVPAFKDEAGNVLLGDAILDRWRARNTGGVVQVELLADVHPAENSEIVLDRERKNRWGDPMPNMTFQLDRASLDRMPHLTKQQEAVLAQLTKSGGGKLVRSNVQKGTLAHEGGGCRMGNDPKTSVCNGHAQTHDHENLYVPGACMLPTPGASFPTLTYVALALRAADHMLGQLGGAKP